MQRKTERPFWTVRLPPSVEELPRLKDEKLGRQLDACIKLDTASDAGVLHFGELLDRNAEEQDGNGKRYGVHFTTNDSFTTNKKIRTCVIVDGSGTPIFKKVTDDVSKVSQDDAALVLKTFLLSKIKEDEE